MSQPTKTILVHPRTLHGFDPAIATASELGRRIGASLFIAGVTGECTFEQMDDLLDDLRASSLDARGDVRWGRASDVLLELAHELDACLIIKTARPTGPLSIFGDTATALLRKSGRPVLIERRGGRVRPRRILAAVNPPLHPDDEDLEIQVVESAVALARLWEDSELHFVTAWKDIGDQRYIRQVSPADRHWHLAEQQLEHADRLRRFLGQCGLPDSHAHVQKGHAAGVIVDVARQLDASLVLVGSAARTGIRGALIGNTVEDVLGASGVSLLGVPRAPARSFVDAIA